MLRLQLTAVKQHFIHLLILEAWGDEETAQGIAAVDRVDLPNALRLVDFMVSRDDPPDLRGDDPSQAALMPEPGSSYAALFAAERSLETRLTRALRAGEETVAASGVGAAMPLISEPLSARGPYQRWLESRSAEGRATTPSPRALRGGAGASLDALFAHLLVIIEQGLVHSFVHWHRGRAAQADAAWEVSGAAMMQAAAITKLLAARRLAPKPAAAARAGEVPSPCIGRGSPEAARLDRRLFERCRALAERTGDLLSESEFARLCRDCELYYAAARDWRPGQELPRIDNPCRGFERVLRAFVRGVDTARPGPQSG